MKTIVIVGLGEVGTAIKKVEDVAKNETFVFEMNSIENPENNIDVMHICIPYSKEFVNVVTNYINSYTPKLVIVHSTTPPGTCDKLKLGSPLVHSPVRGVHPNLYDGVMTFVKYVGGSEESCSLAIKHLKSIGLKAERLGECKDTEMAKIISTTYYGANILFAKMVKEICDVHGYDYEKIYTKPNLTYNEGYKKLGMDCVIRPTLVPPNGKIGGHCVSQNFELLPGSKLKKVVKDLNDAQ